MLIAEHDSHQIRKIIMSTAAVSNFVGSSAGSGLTNGVGTTARFNHPQGLCFSPSETYVLLADYDNRMIRKITLSNSAVTLFVGSPVGTSGNSDGIGTNVLISGPMTITISANESYAVLFLDGTELQFER